MRTAVLLSCLLPAVAAAADEVALKENHFAGFPRVYGGLSKIDAAKGEIEFVSEKTGKMVRLPLRHDAEWLRYWAPASAEDFPQGLRLWLWLSADDKGTPTEVRVVADEISAMAIHGKRFEFQGPTADGKLRFDDAGKQVEIKVNDLKVLPKDWGKLQRPKVLIQTAFNAGRTVSEVLTEEGLEAARFAQYKKNDERIAAAGLPAMVNLSDDLTGELNLTVVRPYDRWVRALDYGDTVQVIGGGEPFPARVTEVVVRGNRTRLLLLAEGRFHPRVRMGAAVALKFPRPKLPADFDEPPDADRRRSPEERVVWLQSNIHCTCPSGGDVCAGDFFTLYMCNSHLCGHPREIAVAVNKWIGEGKTDRQILKLLKAQEGIECCRLHLRP